MSETCNAKEPCCPSCQLVRDMAMLYFSSESVTHTIENRLQEAGIKAGRLVMARIKSDLAWVDVIRNSVGEAK